MQYIQDLSRRSNTDDRLDDIKYSGQNNFHTDRLGSGNHELLEEWKRLYNARPGFIGFYVKHPFTDGKIEGSRIMPIPFVPFKNYYEHLLGTDQGNLGRIRIEDYWCSPHSPVQDCWTMASGGQVFTDMIGAVDAPQNVFNTSLHRYVIENKML